MPSHSPRPAWDIFCTVIDNYGDIGVCWRLARQLATEHGLPVRLWVDDLDAFQPLHPEIDPRLPRQQAGGVEIWHWRSPCPTAAPADVVIEAFGCAIPADYLAAMAVRERPPVWINLEYLSAEAWVRGCHGLPSPHPQLPLTKHFFFPGFDAATGGLLREAGLLDRRRMFAASPAAQAAYWQGRGLAAPDPEALRVSLFAYENPAIPALLGLWAASATPVCCLVPVSRALGEVSAFFGRTLAAGDAARRGALEVRVLPFVPQADYDPLLWACDLNFVRGEDSFVRALWAGKPLVWHIYPQEEAAHRVKLDAFLDLYCAELAPAAGGALRRFWHAWNEGQLAADDWQAWLAQRELFSRHAPSFADELAKRDDLATALVRFCHSKL